MRMVKSSVRMSDVRLLNGQFRDVLKVLEILYRAEYRLYVRPLAMRFPLRS